MKIIFCFLFFCSSLISQSQNVISEKYAVTLTPVFFPFKEIGLQPGFQFKIGNQWSLMTEGGIPVVRVIERNDDYQKAQSLRVTTELKYYPKRSLKGRFYSLQLGYVKRNLTDKDSGRYHNPNATDEIGYSKLEIKSPVFFSSVKWGREVAEWKTVFVDCFLGLGIRIIPTEYNPEGAYTIGPWSSPKDNLAWMVPTPSWRYDKTSIRPHFSMGIRIGRKF